MGRQSCSSERTAMVMDSRVGQTRVLKPRTSSGRTERVRRRREREEKTAGAGTRARLVALAPSCGPSSSEGAASESSGQAATHGDLCTSATAQGWRRGSATCEGSRALAPVVAPTGAAATTSSTALLHSITCTRLVHAGRL